MKPLLCPNGHEAKEINDKGNYCQENPCVYYWLRKYVISPPPKSAPNTRSEDNNG